MAKNAGYTIFALEAGFTEALKINQYVLYGEGGAKEGLKYLNYGVWQIEEFVELIEWMREYNKEKPLHERVKFYGFDGLLLVGSVKRTGFYRSLQFNEVVFDVVVHAFAVILISAGNVSGCISIGLDVFSGIVTIGKRGVTAKQAKHTVCSSCA